MRAAGVQYLLSGFTQSTGFRVFAFEGVSAESARTAYSVTADLALARKHGIRVQELPLLCRGVLERGSEDDSQRTFTFTEGDMTMHAHLARAAIESQKKKRARKPFTAAATAESGSPVSQPQAFAPDAATGTHVMTPFHFTAAPAGR